MSGLQAPPQKPVILTLSMSKGKDLCILSAVAILLCLTPHAHAQGCTQCLDSTHATPPAVQAAYRHAIFLLGGTAAALFIAGTLVLRRER